MREIPRVVGPYEVQLILGVTRERVAQLRRKPDFPEPCLRLATGVLWLAGDIEDWARATGRTYTPYEYKPHLTD